MVVSRCTKIVYCNFLEKILWYTVISVLYCKYDKYVYVSNFDMSSSTKGLILGRGGGQVSVRVVPWILEFDF